MNEKTGDKRDRLRVPCYQMRFRFARSCEHLKFKMKNKLMFQSQKKTLTHFVYLFSFSHFVHVGFVSALAWNSSKFTSCHRFPSTKGNETCAMRRHEHRVTCEAALGGSTGRGSKDFA